MAKCKPTREQQDRYNANRRKKKLEKLSKMTEAEIEEARITYNRIRREKRQRMIPEKRAKWLKQRSDYYQKRLLDPNSHVKIATYGREYNRRSWAKKTPEQKLAEKERLRLNRLSMTPEQVEAIREKGRLKRRALKELVIRHYSNGKMRCMSPTCEVPGGAKDLDILNIDHINGGGKKHMRELKASGFGGYLYDWLRRMNFPSGFQVLCYNCNNKKRITNKENVHATTSNFGKKKFFTQTTKRQITYQKPVDTNDYST